MTLPNKLTIGRILVIPAMIIIACIPYLNQHFIFSHLTYANFINVILFALASATDFLDGHIARKYNLITSFGKFVDPIADKLLVNTSFILLAFHSEVPLVAVLVMIWRDTIVDAIRMMASSKGKVMAAGMLGKLKTVVQMIILILLIWYVKKFLKKNV